MRRFEIKYILDYWVSKPQWIPNKQVKYLDKQRSAAWLIEINHTAI